jgi:C4-dicarboxylate-specific signal transduction histidine kinase
MLDGGVHSFEYRAMGADGEAWVRCVADGVAARHGGRLRALLLNATRDKRRQAGYKALKAEVRALQAALERVEVAGRAREDLVQHQRDEIEQLQAELAHAGRVAMLGTLTSPLAHELNQPLAAIMANAQAALRLLMAQRPNLGEVRAALEDIVRDNRLAADLIQRLRGLIRKDRPPDRVTVDLNLIVHDVVRILHYDAMAHHVQVRTWLAPRGTMVMGDPIELQQIVLNLALNAIEALKKSAIRTVMLRTATYANHVELAVIDHGGGVTKEDLPRLFEPFWTTKPAGTGLGLTICRSLAGAHGGELIARRNRRTRGMTFVLRLKAQEPVQGS